MHFHIAAGIVVDVTMHDMEDAIKKGEEQGTDIIKYLEHHYRFGEENVFNENGIIRTKWSKLAMLSGLLAPKGRKPTDRQKTMIVKSSDLRIDIYAYGNTPEFADVYEVYLIQKNTIVKPEKISAIHIACSPENKIVSFAIPKYRATIRSFFSYEKIVPNKKAKIVLLKKKKKVVFEVDFADYK